ncbi:MAG: hypothetical protein ACUVSW_02885 [Roseiflexus sp.]
MPSQSRSQRRRQQQRARSQQRAVSGRTVETRPLPDEAVTETSALTENELVQSPASASMLASTVYKELPPAGAASRGSTGRETAPISSSRRQRRVARPALEPVDYSLDYEIARHDLRRIAILATLLLAAMVALRLSGLV